MAQKILREFIDDIDGSVAERTFTFAVDGTNYEIDLSSENIAEFKASIAGFVESARRSGSSGTSRSRSIGQRSSSDRERLTAIRGWARENGYNVRDRGRISAEVQQAYDRANVQDPERWSA